MKNTNIVRRLAFAALIVATLSVSSMSLSAQMAGHSMSKDGHSMSKDMMAQKQVMEQAELGLEGYCPVCVIKHGKWVKGKAEHAATFDGVKYYFPSENVKAMFEQDPAAYVPALGGDCVVCYANAGKRVPGNIRFAALNEGRLFLFPSDKERQAFNNSPGKFADTDLGAEGNCIVCKVKAGKTVAGSAAFTSIHDGFRYQFPSDRERQAFDQSAAAYVAADAKMMQQMTEQQNAMQDTSKKAMKTSMIQIQGTTACAACEFGVTPINAPQELGLAVTTADGQIYVIEESHTRWPQLYKDRFEGKQVAVSGDVIKTKGNITWVKPSGMKTL